MTSHEGRVKVTKQGRLAVCKFCCEGNCKQPTITEVCLVLNIHDVKMEQGLLWLNKAANLHLCIETDSSVKAIIYTHTANKNIIIHWLYVGNQKPVVPIHMQNLNELLVRGNR